MKPIGPYVAARELPGQAGAPLPDTPVRTLRATDRLTGMPVLLHVLPYALNLPTLPEHPHLLPITDSGMDGEDAYVVTELPPYAQPASDPRLSASGALSALSALHAAGLTHGGVAPAQLWQFGGTVALAGAGLPWRATPATPEDDLRDLAHTLQALRVLPTPLRPLLDAPQGWTAEQALARLHGQEGRTETRAVGAPEPGTGTPQPPQQPPAPRNEAAPPAAPAGATATAAEQPNAEQPNGGATPPQAGVMDWLDGLTAGGAVPGEPAPEVQTPAAPAAAQTIVASAAAPPPAVTDGGTGPASEPAAEPATGSAAGGSASPSTQAPAAKPVVSPFSGAPAGQIETPQERRRRQNEERRAQAVLDSQAAARRKAARLQAERERAEREADAAPDAAVPPPIQIGFPEGQAPTAPGPSREVERLPASLRRSRQALGDAQPRRLPATTGEASRRRTEPIRIGWDEDDSWRVIRTPAAPPPPAHASLTRWVVPGVAAALLLALLIWAWSALGRPANPVGAAPAACCTVPVTLRGAAGVTATLTVEQAPSGASLKPGQPLGEAPGQLSFPVKGTYRLQVTAQGYTPASLTVTVPRTQPVTINLGD